MADPPPPDDAALGQLLRQAANVATQRLAVALAGQGVTAAEWALLHALHGAGAVPPSLLAERLGATRGAVTRLVDRLRAKRLVVRAAAGGDDRRYQTVALTGAGARLVPVLAAITAQADAALAASLPPRDRVRLAAMLKSLARDARA